jgi:polar amino acid transport system substrate-binding protein
MVKRSYTLLLVLLMLALLALPATACGGDDETTTTAAGSDASGGEDPVAAADAAIAAVTKSDAIETPPTIKGGVLQAGSDTSYPPFEFSDEAGGYIGYDIDICTALAKKMGLELEVVPTAWDGIIPALVSDRYDMIMSAMTITDERKEQINFTDPYIQANIGISAPVDAPVASAEELAGKIVGVQVDTTGQFATEEVEGVKEIKKYDTILSAFQDLEAGRVDAVVNDLPVNAYIIRDKPQFANTGEIVTDDVYGYGIKKENTALLEALNAALAEIKADGTYELIFAKWYGPEEAAKAVQ